MESYTGAAVVILVSVTSVILITFPFDERTITLGTALLRPKEMNTMKSLVNQTRVVNESPKISVDGFPVYIFGDLSSSDIIYTANVKGEGGRNGTVSPIDTTNNDVKNIEVGSKPIHIFGDLTSNRIYVANENSNTVSVVDTSNNTVIKDIPVGDFPQYIYGYLSVSDFIYVANLGSDFVSVIDTANNNSVIQNITVGISPSYIFGVAYSDGISRIIHKLVVRGVSKSNISCVVIPYFDVLTNW